MRERRLTLARDRLGIKPLYYTRQRGGLAFASEIRALRALPEHDFTIEDRAVHDFFSFGHVQKPRSLWREVLSLDPGHVLHLSAEGEPEIRRFWDPRFAVQPGRSDADWIEETRERVGATVRQHMLADVTVGCFLSGGVDSSAIAAAMTHSASAPVKAFTVGFPGTAIDETGSAARIARHLGMEHIVLPLEPVAAGDLLPAVQGAFDEPCAATAAVPIWHLSRLAAEHVKVVLCGEGGASWANTRSSRRSSRGCPPGALHPRKLGFQLPFAEWFRGDFADFAQAAWRGSGAASAGNLQPQAVEALFAEHRAGRANHGRVLYAVAMFAIWWEQTFASQSCVPKAMAAC